MTTMPDIKSITKEADLNFVEVGKIAYLSLDQMIMMTSAGIPSR